MPHSLSVKSQPADYAPRCLGWLPRKPSLLKLRVKQEWTQQQLAQQQLAKPRVTRDTRVAARLRWQSTGLYKKQNRSRKAIAIVPLLAIAPTATHHLNVINYKN